MHHVTFNFLPSALHDLAFSVSLFPFHLANQQTQVCSRVILTNIEEGAYALQDQINVTRRVLVMGHPAALPTINAADAIRGFLVMVRKEVRFFVMATFCRLLLDFIITLRFDV